MKFTHLFGKFTQIFSPKMGKMVGHPDYSFCSHPSKEKKQLVVWCFPAARAFSLAVGLVLVGRSTKILHSSWRSRWMILLMIRNITIGNRQSYKNPESVPQLFSQNQPEENQQGSETNDKEQVWF